MGCSVFNVYYKRLTILLQYRSGRVDQGEVGGSAGLGSQVMKILLLTDHSLNGEPLGLRVPTGLILGLLF